MLKDLEKGNWIIPPWDKRYGRLGHMWKHIQFSNCIISEGPSLRYFIPPELVINPCYKSPYVTSDINDPNVYIESNMCNKIGKAGFRSVLLKTCNLEFQEYIDLLKYKNNIKSNRPRCINCKSEHTGFINKINRLYGLFCCHSCSRLYAINNPDLYEDVAWQVSEFREKGIENSGFNKWWSNIKKARTQFLNRGYESDICNFYLAITSGNTIKFGITNDDIYSRSYHERINSGIPYNSIHYIFSDTRLYVANFEATLKFYTKGLEILEFSELHNVIKLIRELRNKDISNPFESDQFKSMLD